MTLEPVDFEQLRVLEGGIILHIKPKSGVKTIEMTYTVNQ